MNLYHNQAIWEQDVLQEKMTSVEVPTKTPIEECKPIPAFVKKTSSSTNQRRLSLPASDPLHRVFDQMTQPDCDSSRSSHLRRNLSLTERRRSSLLRGLYCRSSLKPSRGRSSSSRPNSVCLDSNLRTLQSKENRLPDQPCLEMNTDSCGNQLNKTELEKENTFLRLALQSCLTKRRGSAPSNLILGDSLSTTNSAVRGSTSNNSNVLLQQACLAATNNRRGSLPSELLNNSLPKQLRNRVLGNNSNSSGGGGKRTSLLRRRSMGTELLSLGGSQMMKERQLVQKYLNRPF